MKSLAKRLAPFLCLLVGLGSIGCRSFVTDLAMKNYRVKIKPEDARLAHNPYQEDFLYLKTLGEEVVPLEDRYFPPGQRADMEDEILEKLGRPGCTYKTFVLSIEEYLAGFNSEHATIEDNPSPIELTGLYPFKVHYQSNDLYVSDIAREYDPALIGRKITAINGRTIPEVEQKLSPFAQGESPWTKKTSFELPPFPYRRPEIYLLAGLTTAISNTVKLDFADHPAVWIAPTWKGNPQWQQSPDPVNRITMNSERPYDCRVFPEQKLAYFQFNSCLDKIAILDGLDYYVKAWVRPLARAWLGIQFHRKKPPDLLEGSYDPKRPVFKDYLAATIGDLNRSGITNLIIDLRYNGGGETELCKQLLYHLTRREDLRDSRDFEFNPKVFAYYDPKDCRELESWYLKKFGTKAPAGQLLPSPDNERPFFYHTTDRGSPYYVAPTRPVFSGRIVVLANQNTGSAASLLAGLMQDNRLAEIVGTTTGNNPTGPTGMTPFKLPHSGIVISLPTEYDERAVPSKGEILQPDHWVENSVSDLLAGRDAVFEKALDLLQLAGALPDVAAMEYQAESHFSAGRSTEAVLSLEKACELEPENSLASLRLAAWQTWFGQNAAYETTRRQLIERALGPARNGSEKAVTDSMERAVKAWCLRPSTDEVEQKKVLNLAQRAAKSAKGESWSPWSQLALGLAEYRNGLFAAADRCLARVAKSRITVRPDVQGTTRLFRAMSLYQQGRLEEAGTLFSKAEADLPPLPVDERIPLDGRRPVNHEVLICWMAYQEAKALFQSARLKVGTE